ncbi:helicase-associated [Pelagophyceae sp. CCMP2097]|nr:helicase-associated [Pelagophyceae sp. CCMP2097]
MLGAVRLGAAAAARRSTVRLPTHSSRGGWEAQYLRLAAYRAAEGHCAVPRKFVTADGTKLGLWVSTQRHAHKAGEMSPERVERLEAAGFVWNVLADGWDAHFELLTAYHAAHGDCAVPHKFVAADGTKLGLWVVRQRQAYKAGEMSPERIDWLEAAGFVWNMFADGWDAHFELLTAYHAAHGDCAVLQNFAAADGTKLGLWVSAQRAAYKKGKLSPAHSERLRAVDFVWRVNRSARNGQHIRRAS